MITGIGMATPQPMQPIAFTYPVTDGVVAFDRLLEQTEILLKLTVHSGCLAEPAQGVGFAQSRTGRLEVSSLWNRRGASTQSPAGMPGYQCGQDRVDRESGGAWQIHIDVVEQPLHLEAVHHPDDR
jgi:hypothetical protein